MHLLEKLVFLSAVYATVSAGQYDGHGDDGGHNDHHEDTKHPYQPYGFGYDIEDGHGNKQWRHEKSNEPWNVVGSYGYKDNYGIMREVDYVADKHGFRAHVRTNEPGTAPKDPAAVKMDAQPIQVKGGYGGGGHDEGYGGGGQSAGYDGGYGGGGGYGDSGHGSAAVQQYVKPQPHSTAPVYASSSGKKYTVVPVYKVLKS